MPGAFSVLEMCEDIPCSVMRYCLLFVRFEHCSLPIQQQLVQLRSHRGGLLTSQFFGYPFDDFLHHRRPSWIAQLELIGIQLPSLPHRFVDNGSFALMTRSETPFDLNVGWD